MSNCTNEPHDLNLLPSIPPTPSGSPTPSRAPSPAPSQPATKAKISKKLKRLHKWVHETSKLAPRRSKRLPSYDPEAAALQARNEALKVEYEAAVALAHQKMDAALKPPRRDAENVSINGVRASPKAKPAHPPLSRRSSLVRREQQRMVPVKKVPSIFAEELAKPRRKIHFYRWAQSAEFNDRGWVGQSWVALKGGAVHHKQ